MEFPKQFRWGAASSSYQIEGYSQEDGGGKNIWDAFCQKEGTILDGSDGSVACDSYHRYQEDIALIASMNLSVYRFSMSWARVDPLGDGNWNEAGFQYYEKVIDCCIAQNIEPFLTLYHWELPLALEEKGGWRNRDTAFAFARYAQEVARRFGPKVTHFITFNEPQCTVFLGHGNGLHAPGLKMDLQTQFSVLHHQLLAHGLSVPKIRQEVPHALVGLASTGRLCYPATPADEEDAYRISFGAPDDDWGFTHSMILDPVCLGHYPTDVGPGLEKAISQVDPADLQIISAPVDFLGLNIYNGSEIANGNYCKKPQGHAITALGWPVTPKVLEWGPYFVHRRYGLPIYITENGMSCHDVVSLDGKVHDPNRIDFLARHLQALHSSIQKGTPILGYLQWSLTDNFEWNAGYSQRFGLVYMDYATQNRIPKDSATWYSQVAKNNSL